MPPIPPDQVGPHGAASASVRHEPLAYRIPDACRVAGIGKSMLYAMAQAGEIKLTKIRGRTLVPRAELQRLIAEGQKGSMSAA